MATHWQELDSDAIEFCVKWGNERQADRKARNAPHNNNLQADNAESVALHLLGIHCEAAGWKYLNGRALAGRWEYYSDKGHLSESPDFLIGGLAIDVKGVDRNHKNLIVPAGNHPNTGRPYLKRDWLYLLVGAESHPRYAVLGWATGEAMAASPVKELCKGRPAHIRQRADLEDAADLQAMLAARHTAAVLNG